MMCDVIVLVSLPYIIYTISSERLSPELQLSDFFFKYKSILCIQLTGHQSYTFLIKLQNLHVS